jgi:hypothetical protein
VFREGLGSGLHSSPFGVLAGGGACCAGGRGEDGARLSVFGDRGRKEEVHRLTQILTDEEKPGIGFQTQSVGFTTRSTVYLTFAWRSVKQLVCRLGATVDKRAACRYDSSQQKPCRQCQMNTAPGSICANLCESVDGRSVFGDRCSGTDEPHWRAEEGVHRWTQIFTGEEKLGIGFQTQSVGSICANLCESVDERSVFGDRCSGTDEAYWRAEEGIHRWTQILTDGNRSGGAWLGL